MMNGDENLCRLMMKWVCLSWSQCQVHNVQLILVGVVQFSYVWSGGRGGGEEEVVKNQAVISISYQVLNNVSNY